MTLPAIADLNTYGGVREDYAPVEDASTDVGADELNNVFADVAGMTQTACRAWVRFVGHATTPADPSSNVHGAVWGDDPSVKPTVAKGGTGIYDVTWPTTINDELDVDYTINLRSGWVSVEGTTLYFYTVTPTGPNTFRVRVFNTGFAANDAAGVTFALFVI